MSTVKRFFVRINCPYANRYGEYTHVCHDEGDTWKDDMGHYWSTRYLTFIEESKAELSVLKAKTKPSQTLSISRDRLESILLTALGDSRFADAAVSDTFVSGETNDLLKLIGEIASATSIKITK